MRFGLRGHDLPAHRPDRRADGAVRSVRKHTRWRLHG
jgi:hypothetical protein